MANGNPPNIPPLPPGGGQPTQPQAPPHQSQIQQPPQTYQPQGPAGYEQVPPPPPGPPGYSQMPPPPEKRSGCLKPALIALGVLFGFIIIAVVIIFAVVGVGVHRAVKEVTDRQVVSVAMGQAGKTGDLSIKVDGWQPSPGDEIFKPGDGNQFIMVNLEITNTGKTTESVSTMTEMSIKTPEGYKYTLAPYFPEPRYPDGEILPGQSAKGYVAFEVPQGIGAMNFVFEPILIGDIIEVKLQ